MAVGRGIAGAGGDGVDRGKEGVDLVGGNDVVKGRTVVCMCWCAPRWLLWSERGWSSGPAVALLSTSPSYVGESTPSSASPSASDAAIACLCPGLMFAGVVVEVLVFLARVPVEGDSEETEMTDAPESVMGSLSSSDASYAGESTLVRVLNDDPEMCMGCFDGTNGRFWWRDFEFDNGDARGEELAGEGRLA